jgi:hypothetical protein
LAEKVILIEDYYLKEHKKGRVIIDPAFLIINECVLLVISAVATFVS